jgi:hypothetical protein
LLRRVGWAVVLVVLFGIGDTMWTLRSAEQFFRLLGTLTPGKSSLAEAQQLLRFRPFINESDTCSIERCSLQFQFESRLSRWHLIQPRRGFLGYVDIKNNFVQTIHFSYAEGASPYVSVTEGPSASPQGSSGSVDGLSILSVSPEKRRSVAKVWQFGDMPVGARTKTLQPNVWCLVNLEGCQRPQNILPGTRLLAFEPQ